MRRRVRSLFVSLAGPVAVSVAFVMSGLSQAQLSDEPGYISWPKMSPGDLARLGDFQDGKASLRGVTQQETQKNEELLDRAAQYYVYRLTDKQYQRPAEPGSQQTPSYLMRDVERRLVPPDPKKPLTSDQQMYLKKFGAALTTHAKRVVKSRDLIARVNAARILARVAECGQYEVADTLIEILNDPQQNDGVKHWILRGMRELFQAAQLSPTKPTKDLEARCILAVLKYLERKPDLPTTAPKPQLDAVGFVRREAIRTLAETRFPAVPGAEKNEGLTALALTNVILRKDYFPEPRMGERVEAALALSRLNPALSKSYQPRVAAHLLGWFVVELLQASSATGIEPWKAHAARLAAGLERFRADVKADPVSLKIIDMARGLLLDVEKANASAGNNADLRNFLQQNPPPDANLYQGMEQSAINFVGLASS